jgi:hypothetical protein
MKHKSKDNISNCHVISLPAIKRFQQEMINHNHSLLWIYKSRIILLTCLIFIFPLAMQFTDLWKLKEGYRPYNFHFLSQIFGFYCMCLDFGPWTMDTLQNKRGTVNHGMQLAFNCKSQWWLCRNKGYDLQSKIETS